MADSRHSLKVLKTCLVCGNNFIVHLYRKDTAKYCSHACYATTVHLQPRTAKFYEAMSKIVPWNKGKHHSKDVLDKLKKSSRVRWNRELVRRKKVFGKEYNNLHYWLRQNLGSAKECVLCGENKKRCGWANISGEYKKDLTDYISLCNFCHHWFDKGDKEIEKKVKELK